MARRSPANGFSERRRAGACGSRVGVVTVTTGKAPQQWLKLVCEQWPQTRFGVLLSVDLEQKKLKPLARWPEGFSDLQQLRPVVRDVLRHRKPVCLRNPLRDDSNPADVCAVPITVGNELCGVVMLALDPLDEGTREELPTIIQRHTSWLALGNPRRAPDEHFYQGIVGLMASCLEQESYARSTVSLVSRLTRDFECDRVAYGEYRGHFSRVTAISNSASFDERSNLVRQIANCMDEAIDQDRLVVFPDSSGTLIHREHRKLADACGFGAVLTVPLVHDGRVLGAVTLMRVGDARFSDDRVLLCEQSMAMVGPHLSLLRERWPPKPRKPFRREAPRTQACRDLCTGARGRSSRDSRQFPGDGGCGTRGPDPARRCRALRRLPVIRHVPRG